MPAVTVLYAGLLGLMALGLAMPVGRKRGEIKVSLGDGGNSELLLATRRHANFIEWVPLILILMGLLEANGVAPLAIHGFGIALLVARISHAIGLKADTIEGAGRLIGAAGTALILLVASVWAIALFWM